MIMNITVLKGDGIGPEIVTQGLRVLETIAEKYHHDLIIKKALIGGDAIDNTGTPLPNETIKLCKDSDAILLGAVGGPKWDNLKGPDRPEMGLLNIRKELELYANIRPAKLFESLRSASPLKDHIIARGFDICIVRELTGGIYFGEKGMIDDNTAYDTEIYSKFEIERIARKAFDIARLRNKHVTSIDKMNVLMTSRLWRDTVIKVHKDYSDVRLDHMLVDNGAMQLINDPSQFDVILTSNMFGDILSDEASMLTGSLGMLPSASLGCDSPGIFEPIHGSAPDIANEDKANPIATILSVAMLLRYSFNLSDEADSIERAVIEILELGYRTIDIHQDGFNLVGAKEMGALIASKIN